MAALYQHIMMRNSVKRFLSLGHLPLHFATQHECFHENPNRTRHRMSIPKLESKMNIQVFSFHSGNLLFKKSSKAIQEDQLEPVNIFSPLGKLIAEGTPIIYLQRMCKSFDSHTYKECNYRTTTHGYSNLRNLQFIRNEISDESSEKSGRKRKGQNRETLSSIQDFQTIRKIQADIVNDGESQLTLKSKATSGNLNRKVMDLEHFAKNHLQDLCTFHITERSSSIAVFKLKRKTEDDQFYKNVFDIIYAREKDEVNMMIDYYNTVKSFSEESKNT